MAANTFETVVLPLLTEDPTPVITWLQQKELLRRAVQCEKCHNNMNWTKHSKCVDRVVWKCQTKGCTKYKGTTSIRTGSFFARSRLSLQKWVHIMYLWSERIGETTASRQINLSEKTTIDCFSFFREICASYFQANPVMLGGPGITVEIDESCFSHKPKYHRERAPFTPTWVFGIVDRSTKPAVGYMEIVEARDAATLLPIVSKVVQPGSIIHSDEWRAYRNIQGLGYQHKTVNHSVNFVDRRTGVHTQTIESYWNRHKSYIKKMRGCKRDMLSSYLQEFMWHDRFSKNTFEKLCEHIAAKYPL
uniref:ISXO2-like transposase domain-containing protein n=1 Tax=Scylla olivacea TaxID=85551 RepID=A0A0P4WJT7_SCYOL